LDQHAWRGDDKVQNSFYQEILPQARAEEGGRGCLVMSILGLFGLRDRLIVQLIPDDLYLGLISYKKDAYGGQIDQEYKDSDS
jgi:hypothetical protein